MRVYETGEHDAVPVPSEAPGPAIYDDIDLRHRKPLYADGEIVREEYVMLCNQNANDEWLTIERRDRARFDRDRELVFDLSDVR